MQKPLVPETVMTRFDLVKTTRTQLNALNILLENNLSIHDYVDEERSKR